MSTTINPVQTPVAQAPAFKGKKAPKDVLKTIDKLGFQAVDQIKLSILAKTNPTEAKEVIARDSLKKLAECISKILK